MAKPEMVNVLKKLADPVPLPINGTNNAPGEHGAVVRCPELGRTAGTIPRPVAAPRHDWKKKGSPKMKVNGFWAAKVPVTKDVYA